MDEPTRTRANELYWDSDDSVGSIAEDLGVSRRTLYDNIDPIPAGADCPECGAPLGYRNRTAADHGEAECGECGYEADIAAEEGTGDRPEGPEVERDRRGARLMPTGVRGIPRAAASGPVLGTLLLLGLALGAALGYVLRRR